MFSRNAGRSPVAYVNKPTEGVNSQGRNNKDRYFSPEIRIASPLAKNISVVLSPKNISQLLERIRKLKNNKNVINKQKQRIASKALKMNFDMNLNNADYKSNFSSYLNAELAKKKYPNGKIMRECYHLDRHEYNQD